MSAKLEDVASTTTTYHRILEAIKFAYGIRCTLGDPAFSDLTEVCQAMVKELKVYQSTPWHSCLLAVK